MAEKGSATLSIKPNQVTDVPPEQIRKVAAGAFKQSDCPVSRTRFHELAKALKVKIGDREVIADPKDFSTGSFGWYGTDKITVTLITADGTEIPLKVQVGLNLTVVGSKEVAR